MSAVPKPIYNADQYLTLEQGAEYRSQFYFGEIFAMAGASRRHNVVSANVLASIHAQLKGRSCEVYQNDMRVKVNADFYTYPDIVIVCGEPQIEKKNGENLLDPAVLIEVLSPSTEKFDRGDKFRFYRLMPSLKEYVLVSQDRVNVEHYFRQEDNSWLFTVLNDEGDVLELPSVSCSVNLKDIYDKVDLGEETFD
ncbi:MAG: Uma2 family endonuclease [Pyrinomonadaceae bacterium]